MGSAQSTATVRRRYGWVASIYEWANLEGVLYADARVRAIELLDLRPGARVLDLACGTGANFALIEQRIGHTGELVGVDVTPQMLDKAHARAARGVGAMSACEKATSVSWPPSASADRSDAAVCTLGLSVIPQWQRAWEAMLSSVRPGGCLAIMDAGYPKSGRRGDAVISRPLAWALSRLFAADCTRRPWPLLQSDTGDGTIERFTWGGSLLPAAQRQQHERARTTAA
jgi:ubiquinone/menaquinone biosynthesis C-methylase UbiE